MKSAFRTASLTEPYGRRRPGSRPVDGVSAGRPPGAGAARDHEARSRLDQDIPLGRVGDGHVRERRAATGATHREDAGAVVGPVDGHVADLDVRYVAATVLELNAVVR